ncbi:MAG TPA: AAA family ATPase [Candidatus Onthousia faecigallinarum]|nr:AAA family ATPase [Candidatus Onthousia faecigallinarum]
MSEEERQQLQYDNLNNSMKTYVNKTMDIYHAIENKKVVQEDEVFGPISIMDMDKQYLSFLLAGYLVEGPLQKSLSSYSLLRDNYFHFLSLKPEEIVPLEDDQYKELYQKKFIFDLKDVVKRSLDLQNSVEFYKKIIQEPRFSVIHHKINETLKLRDNGKKKTDDLLSKTISKKEPLSFQTQKGVTFDRVVEATTPLKTVVEEVEIEVPKEDRKKEFVMTKEVFDLLPGIEHKFVAQEQFAEALFRNLVFNQRRALSKEDMGARSIIFVDGASGTGKTAITKEIAEKLGVPFKTTSITSYSATGYAGADLTSLLVGLYQLSDGDLKKAERGIIVLDEFDKIAYSSEEVNDLKMKKAVQQQLLDFMGGGKYELSVKGEDKKKSTTKIIEFDTSSLTFVCLGALTKLREQAVQKKNPIGFGAEFREEVGDHFEMSPQALMDIGIEKELAGRINVYLYTEDYSKENYVEMLKNSDISPMIGLQNLLQATGNSLLVNEDAYQAMAEEAYHLNMGARGLQLVANSLRNSFLDVALEKTGQEIKIDREMVDQVMNDTFDRKVRK